MGTKIISIGLPKTGTSTLKKVLDILGYVHKIDYLCGDYVHLMNTWKAEKYILTLRSSPEVWFDSVLRWSKRPEKSTKYFRKFRKRVYGSPIPIAEKYINTYNRHIRETIVAFDPLIVCWENGDGWKEICNYLECDIPNIKFPHENKNTVLSRSTH